jgi:nucleotide-binding universal stress UspA family protein
MKILLPVDGSEFTKRMLGYLAAHDELLGPTHEYTFATAVPRLPSYPSRFIDRGTIDAYYLEQAEEVLKPVRAFAEQKKWSHRELQLHGHAADEIARIAEAEKFDLIVMGSHGHTALGNVVLGSVAMGVLARCKVPVLLIR